MCFSILRALFLYAMTAVFAFACKKEPSKNDHKKETLAVEFNDAKGLPSTEADSKEKEESIDGTIPSNLKSLQGLEEVKWLDFSSSYEAHIPCGSFYTSDGKMIFQLKGLGIEAKSGGVQRSELCTYSAELKIPAKKALVFGVPTDISYEKKLLTGERVSSSVSIKSPYLAQVFFVTETAEEGSKDYTMALPTKSDIGGCNDKEQKIKIAIDVRLTLTARNKDRTANSTVFAKDSPTFIQAYYVPCR